MAPVRPICNARSGVTTPMPTVRCFQMRLSVSKVSYSSTQLGETLREVVDEVQQRALTVLVHASDRLGVLDLADLVLRHRVRQIAVHATRTEVGRVHARTRNRFVHVKEVFTLTEAVDQDVDGATVETVGAQPHQVIQQRG